MENVELFSTSGSNSVYIVGGDVYGLKGVEKQIRGFKVGTKALYSNHVGTVTTLMDDLYCLWKNDETGKYIEVIYDDLIKLGE
jgi:hypothetical protein